MSALVLELAKLALDAGVSYLQVRQTVQQHGGFTDEQMDAFDANFAHIAADPLDNEGVPV